MRVSLDKENRFLASDGKVDLKQVFMYSGVKAAWCYKKGTATPEDIREMSEATLLRMGVQTFASDHGTPDEHYEVSIEATGIPKILCMILNNEKQYTADERSLRYTKVLPSEEITYQEVDLYNKWHKIFQDLLWHNYKEFFMKTNEMDEDKAFKSAGKIAQENARNFVSVLTPTSISYTAPWYQWQKLAAFLLDMAKNPTNELARLAAPYAVDFVNQLVDLRLVVTTKQAAELYPNIVNELHDDRELLYRNNKGIKLSLFAENNPFSGIDMPNEYAASINYNTKLSLSAVAQEHRHRTTDTEIRIPEEYSFVIPELIKGTDFEIEYVKDMMKVEGLFPQGQIVDVNIISSIKKLINYMGKERACDRAQQEIEDWYVNKLIPDIIKGLEQKTEYAKQYQLLKTSYLNRCRCAYPDYHCPTPCGHPRTRRPF